MDKGVMRRMTNVDTFGERLEGDNHGHCDCGENCEDRREKGDSFPVEYLDAFFKSVDVLKKRQDERDNGVCVGVEQSEGMWGICNHQPKVEWDDAAGGELDPRLVEEGCREELATLKRIGYMNT